MLSKKASYMNVGANSFTCYWSSHSRMLLSRKDSFHFTQDTTNIPTPAQVYKEGVYDITRNCGLESERRGVESFVEVSDAALKYLQEVSVCVCVCVFLLLLLFRLLLFLLF